MIKKIYISLLIAVLFFSSSSTLYLPEIKAESVVESPAPTEKVGSFILPDNPPTPPIGSDSSRYNQDVELVMDLIVNEGKDMGHTGFQAKLWEWSDTPVLNSDGELSQWVEQPTYHTDNGHIEKQDYRASDFTADELGVSEAIYAKLVAENTPIDIEIDSREDTMQNYRAYVVPTQEEVNAMLARGETPYAFLYYNNDVKLNFKFNYLPPPPIIPPPPTPSGERQEVVHVPPSWGSGSVSWGMFKDTLKESGSSETKIRWVNGLAAGSHYAQTASAHKMSGVVSTSAKSVDRVAGAKGSETYSLSYDYTDHRIDYYNCSRWDSEEDEDGNIIDWTCGGWTKVGEAPDWSQTKTYSCSVALPVDHKYGETFQGEHGISKEMNIGRSATVDAQGCSPSEDAPKTEKITHESAPVQLPTQTHMSFMEQPIQWTGTPMYNNANVFPYVAKDSQGVAGVPELDQSFKTLNKYVDKTAEFDNPYSIPLRNEVKGTQMNIFSKEDFWVSRSTGFVTSTLHGTTVNNAKVQAGYEFKTVTGQEYRDEILDRADLTSMYYLPIDANNNVMKPNTAYKMETKVDGLGYNNITILHDQDFLFENYLIGSVFEEEGADVEGVWIVEQNEIPINDIMYTHSALITPQEAATISAATKGRTNFIFGHKGTDNMAVYDQVKQALNYENFGEALSKKIPHVIDVKTANQTLN